MLEQRAAMEAVQLAVTAVQATCRQSPEHQRRTAVVAAVAVELAQHPDPAEVGAAVADLPPGRAPLEHRTQAGVAALVAALLQEALVAQAS